MKRIAFVAAHLVFAAFQLLSALYCLLAYLPFTYHQVHAGGLIPWVDAFARLHPWFNLAMLAVVFPLLIGPWKRGGAARRLAVAFALGEAALAALLVLHPVLTGLENSLTSWYWSLGLLAPLAALAVVEVAAYAGEVQWTDRSERSAAAFAACASAVFVTIFYAALSELRRSPAPALPQEAAAAGWSLLLHLLIFLGTFLVIECLVSLAGLLRRPARAEFWLSHALLITVIYLLLQIVVWPALGFTGWPQLASSLAIGSVLACLNAAVALRLSAGQTLSDGIGAATAPALFGLPVGWRSGAIAVLGLGGLGCLLAWQSAEFDWNGLLQKLTAAAIWLASFACFYTIGGRFARVRSLAWLVAPLAILGAYKGLGAAQLTPGPALERWAAADPSFRLAQQLLARHRPDQESFFQFLGRNTDIPASVHVDPPSVDLTPTLAPSSGPRPDIFIFTIDSLRRDYLSPYNPEVSFTPAIAAFARESTVFTNAFTRYGGTGLSEPSIWSGSLLLHKQYITPFAPINALEKMLRADGYEFYLTRDPILGTLLRSDDPIHDLDPPAEALAADFPATLARLEQKIDQRGADARPIFVYTQPQNLHISVIQREGKSVPAGESYPGFYAPYAARVRQIDAAFGKFIEFLKARGLYEHSIVVLTSDHGDSLGEDGRWGHAYTLYPEIVRIPLLIHLPEEMRSKISNDPQALAFSIDITPSLYYLLGHRPITRNPLFGSPLFTETPAERPRDPQGAYLLASSYGAVYGVLSSGGRRLYIADGVNYQNERFDLSGPLARKLPLNEAEESSQNGRIREAILSLDRFYHVGESQEGRP